MESAWTKSKKDVLDFFGVDEDRGLSDEQIRRAQEKYGPNGKLQAIFKSAFKWF